MLIDGTDETTQTALDDCPICNAALGASSTFPWHFADEDCRAIREPLIPTMGNWRPIDEAF